MDLFSRIAAQQRDTATALKPVLPPRFAPRGTGTAPAAAAGSRWGDGALEPATWPPSAASPASADDAPTGANGPAPSTSARGRHGPDDHPGAQALDAAASAPGTRPPASSPTALRSAAEPAPPDPGVLRARLPITPPRSNGVGGPGATLGALEGPGGLENLEGRGDLGDVAPSPPAPARSATPSAAFLPSTVTRVPPFAPSPSSPLGAPLSPARAQALSPRPLPATSAASAPPVVHVHIDRIDVRAPAAAPARPAPARPARTAAPHTLADYLRGGVHRS